MRCLKNHEIRSYLDGEIGPARRSLVEGHLSSCPRCRSAADRIEADIQRIRDSLETLLPENVPAPPDLLRWPDTVKTGRQPWRKTIFRPVRVPAAVLVLLLSVLVGLSGLLLSQSLKTEHGTIEPKGFLDIRSAGTIQTVPLPLDMRDFRPVKDPQIIVFKEF